MPKKLVRRSKESLNQVSSEMLSYNRIVNVITISNKAGKLHRVAGPAKILWRKGKYYCENWYSNGLLHNLKGPAVFVKTYRTIRMEWHIAGKLHRVEGPAIYEVIYKNNKAAYKFETYALNGETLTKEEWLEKLPELNQIAYLFNMR